jgi:hypothetical protein
MLARASRWGGWADARGMERDVSASRTRYGAASRCFCVSEALRSCLARRAPMFRAVPPPCAPLSTRAPAHLPHAPASPQPTSRLPGQRHARRHAQAPGRLPPGARVAGGGCAGPRSAVGQRLRRQAPSGRSTALGMDPRALPRGVLVPQLRPRSSLGCGVKHLQVRLLLKGARAPCSASQLAHALPCELPVRTRAQQCPAGPPCRSCDIGFSPKRAQGMFAKAPPQPPLAVPGEDFGDAGQPQQARAERRAGGAGGQRGSRAPPQRGRVCVSGDGWLGCAEGRA